MDYQHNLQSVQLVVHQMIWCRKRRRPVLVGLVRTRVEQLSREAAAEHDGTVIEAASQPKHVHLFPRATPYTLPSESPRLIKGRSAPDLRAVPALATAAVAVDALVLAFDRGQRESGHE